MRKRIFISKNEGEIQPFLNNFKANDWDVIAHSFLSFEPVDFEVQALYDILFFSSPRSVTFFKTRLSIPSHVLIACIGEKTKEVLKEMGHVVSFSRDENESLSNFALSFKNWSQKKRVLFPISSISLKTISSQFPNEQKEELTVYSTKIIGRNIEECDTYVFTSPSNVIGFLKNNTFPKSARIISWGESTSKYLLENGGRIDVELKNSSLKELVNVVLSEH